MMKHNTLTTIIYILWSGLIYRVDCIIAYMGHLFDLTYAIMLRKDFSKQINILEMAT